MQKVGKWHFDGRDSEEVQGGNKFAYKEGSYFHKTSHTLGFFDMVFQEQMQKIIDEK